MTSGDLPSGEEAIELMVALINNACVNDGTKSSGFEFRSVKTVQDYLGETGIVVEPIDGRASVVFRISGRRDSAPTLLMIPHLDVVPASAQDWTYDPFAGTRSDGIVWGRGAVDMLNVTAAMVVVFRWLRDGLLAQPEGDVILACVADEEAGGTYGAKYLVDNRWDLVECDYVLTEVAGPTIGSADDPALPVTVAEKGPMWRKTSTQGIAGHGSQPFGRSNAVVTMADAFARIADADQPVSITDEWADFVPHLAIDDELRRMLLDPDLVDAAIEAIAESDLTLARWIHACTHMTLSPNVLRGGTKVNMVPDSATGVIDIRVLPGQDIVDLDDHLHKVLGPDLLDSIELTAVNDMLANSSPASGPLWDAIADAAEEHLGTRQLAPTLTPVTTDARFFRERGIPAYGVGLFDDAITFPEMLEMFHGVDERISEESVRQTTRFLGSVVTAFSERASLQE